MIGLWQAIGDRTGIDNDEVTGAGIHGGVRSLLLTRRPNLAMWERSKLPEGKDEAKVRDMLSRRYDLCDWTVVSTATLLTARRQAGHRALDIKLHGFTAQFTGFLPGVGKRPMPME